MNIVLVNQFFPPARAPTGRLLGDLAGELVRRGHSVTVLASAADYGAATGPADGAFSGVQVVRTGRAGLHRHGLGAKLGDYLSFFRGAWRELSRRPRPDALVCMTTPPFAGWIGAHLRKRQGVPYVLWCMDLYPEALAAHGILRRGNPVFRALERIARTERSRASGVIALGPDMAVLLESSGAFPVDEIPVWSHWVATPEREAEARALRRSRGWADDETILLYSGNMGRAHRAEEFAALSERLEGRSPRCRLVFSGNGPLRAEWERRWGSRFEFLPPAPEETCAAHLLAADVHLVSQQPEWTGVVVPSKFPAACALGRPTVFAGPPRSAVGQWLSGSDAGWILPPGDASAIEAAAGGILDARLRAEKGHRAFSLFEQKFTRERNCGRVADRVEQAAKDRT